MARYTPAVSGVEDALRRVLEPEPGVRLVALFGSTARGQVRAASDVDVGVLGVEASRLGTLSVALSRAAGRQVDLVALETAPPLLRFEIARDGRALIERPPHTWSDFRARAMVDWWDWAPYARRFHRAAAARLRQPASYGSS
jgi:predicted nucleotidyltransferase